MYLRTAFSIARPVISTERVSFKLMHFTLFLKKLYKKAFYQINYAIFI